MLNFYIGGAKEGKSYALLQKISQLSNNNEKILIIVPEQYSYEFDKKLYDFVGAEKFNKITAFSFTTLANDIIKKYGDSRFEKEYANDNKKNMMLNMAINIVYQSGDEQLFFKKQFKKVDFLENISQTISRLKQSGISATDFSEKINRLNGKLFDKVNDISKIYLIYEKLMSEYKLKDNMDNITYSASIANKFEYFNDTTVIIDEFESFTGAQYDMLKVIISQSKDAFIALRSEDVNADKFSLFDVVNQTYRTLCRISTEYRCDIEVQEFKDGLGFKKDDLKFITKNIFRSAKSKPSLHTQNIKIFEARDCYNEVDFVCAKIKRLIFESSKTDAPLKYKDFAIVSSNIQQYSSLLENSFDKYEIPFFMSVEKTVAHTSIMMYINALLDLISSKNYSTELIMKYLKTGMTNINIIETSELENFCYKWSITKEKWTSSFIPNNVDENDLKTFEKFEYLRKKIITPLNKLKTDINKNPQINNICKLFYGFICKNNVENKINELIEFYLNNNKSYLANELKRIWDYFINIIDDIYNTIPNSIVSPKEFSKILKPLLSAVKYSIPPQTLDSVIVAPANMARLTSPSIIFILGANDGEFPSSSSNAGFFSNAEKETLSNLDISTGTTLLESISSSRLNAYKSLSFATEKLFITYPLTNIKGESQTRSSVINEITNMFVDGKNIILHESNIPIEFYAVTAKSAYYHFMQNKKTQDKSVASIKSVLDSDEFYRQKIELSEIKIQNQNNDHVNSDTIQKLLDFNFFKLSQTAFEEYNKCHFKYFCQYCLKLRKIEKIEFNGLNLGNMIHYCFDALLKTQTKENFVNMSDDTLKSEITKLSAEYKNSLFKNDFITDSATDLIYDNAAKQILIIANHLQAELKTSKFTPKQFELNINDSVDFAPMSIKTDGGIISFGGIVDRVDTYIDDLDNKYLRVIDYKSTGKNITQFHLNNGLNMQMLLYMYTLTENNSIYSDYIPSGALYSTVTLKMPASESRNDTLNTKFIEKSLKNSGIIINDVNVINAMDSSGKYIEYISKRNSIPPVTTISKDKLESLKNFCNNKLIEMYNSLLDGDIESVPLINKGYNIDSCNYCNYVDICGNNSKERSRSGDEFDDEKLIDIFSKEDNE